MAGEQLRGRHFAFKQKELAERAKHAGETSSFAFDIAFPDAWRVAEGEVRVSESFCRFQVRAQIENIFLLKSFALVYACIDPESYFCI